MSDKVIQFPNAIPATGLGDRVLQQEKVGEEQVALIAAVRAAAESNKKFPVRNDEITVAQAVNKRMREAKSEKKFTQVQLREELKKRGHCIPKIDRLHLPWKLDPAEAKRIAPADLRKKIQPYVRVLDVLADVLGLVPDSLIFEAFRDTSFRLSASISIDDPASTLSWLLNRMTSAVIRWEGMAEYFEKVQRRSAGYDRTSDQFLLARLEARYQRAYEGSVDWSLNLHPLPSIPLARVHRATFSGPLRVERKIIASPSLGQQEVAAICSPKHACEDGCEPFALSQRMNAQLRVYSNIRLAIGPRTDASDLGPLFEIHSNIELWSDGALRPLTFNLSSFPISAREDTELGNFVGSVAAKFHDGWRRITGFSDSGWSLVKGEYRTNEQREDILSTSQTGPRERDPVYFGTRLDAGLTFDALLGEGGSEWAVYWQPVDRPTVAQFVDILSPEPLERRWEWLCPSDGPRRQPHNFLFAAEGCRQLEAAIHSGAMEECLRTACRHLKEKLTLAEKQVDEDIRKQINITAAHWNKTEES